MARLWRPAAWRQSRNRRRATTITPTARLSGIILYKCTRAARTHPSHIAHLQSHVVA